MHTINPPLEIYFQKIRLIKHNNYSPNKSLNMPFYSTYRETRLFLYASQQNCHIISFLYLIKLTVFSFLTSYIFPIFEPPIFVALLEKKFYGWVLLKQGQMHNPASVWSEQINKSYTFFSFKKLHLELFGINTVSHLRHIY